MHRRSIFGSPLGLAAVLALTALLLPPARAAQVQWRPENFTYLAQNKPLKEFLREFAASQGLSIVISAAVDGTVNGKFDLTPLSLLDLMSTSFGLCWFYDGRVLYVQPAAEMSSEVVRLSATTVEQLRSALTSLDIADSRYPIAFDGGRNTALVSGPRRYVEIVKQIAGAIDQNEISRGIADIRVFRLHYAWAADYVYTQNGHEHRLPGVASVLRELYAPRGRAVPSSPARLREEQLSRMRRFGLIREETADASAPSEEAAPVEEPPPATEDASAPAGGPDLPQFQPDGRMNAIVVRDRPERMSFYEAVIRELDVKSAVVEIEARILEVSTDAIDSLGIDWRLRSNHVDLTFNRGDLSNLTTGDVLSGNTGAGVAKLGGAMLTTVLADSGERLIARVNALAEKGKANILASPRVMTLDNVEAVFESLHTFFVRVSGNLDVALYNVSAGTSLRVTPLVVTDGDRSQVKLAVRIEDGSLSSQTVDQIPVIQRSAIGTQAFISEGESLLIGGYENEVRRDAEVGVPGLAAVPVLGSLFKHREKRLTHVQRLFLLTPRVIQP
jgi:type III secretion protein C